MYKQAAAGTTNRKWYDVKSKKFYEESESLVKDYRDRPAILEAMVLLQLGLHYNEMDKNGKNFEEKRMQLEKSGGVEVDTEIIVPLITNRDKFKNAPEYLPKTILLTSGKVLIMRKGKNIVKYEENKLANVILCEPWREDSDFNELEGNCEVYSMTEMRRKEILPYS